MNSPNDTPHSPEWQELEELDEGHRQQLIDSGISAEVAKARGYSSAYNRPTLRAAGFERGPIGGMLIPVRCVDGTKAYVQYRPDRPETRNGKEQKYLFPPNTAKRIDVHPSIRGQVSDPSVDLWVTEGIKKTDSAISHGLCCVGLMDVWAFGNKGAYGDFEPHADWEHILIQDRTVYICYDSDVMTKAAVHRALRKFRQFLKARGATVNVIYLPDQEDGSKQGLDDFLASGKSVADLYALASDELRGPRERLRLSSDLPEMGAKAWVAIAEKNDPVALVLYGGLPSRIEQVDGAPVVIVLTDTRMRHELALRVQPYKVSDDGTERDVLPPMWLIEEVLATHPIPLPRLRRIVEVPVFAPDGSLQEEPGYSPKTQTYHAPSPSFSLSAIPQYPSAVEVAAAIAVLTEEVLGDFPFITDADKAHALAFLLLPYVRDLIDGPTPLHSIEAPQPGTGKDCLANVVAIAATGRLPHSMPQAGDDNEWRKRLTAALRLSPSLTVISNLTQALDSGALAGALTASIWTDRLLGSSQEVSLPVRTIWAVTANNPVMSTEMVRRSIRIRLDAKVERPWQREGFRHPNLEGWVKKHRAEVVPAALTLVRHWFAQGAPRASARMASYDEWAGIMGGILDSSGIPGFLTNLTEFYDAADLEGAGWRGFVELWWQDYDKQPVRTKDLWPIAQEAEGLDFGKGSDKARQTTFGINLRKQRDRIIAGCRIEQAAKSGGYQRYQLVRIEPEDDIARKQREAHQKTQAERKAKEQTGFAGMMGGT
jgi:hypothetical protein